MKLDYLERMHGTSREDRIVTALETEIITLWRAFRGFPGGVCAPQTCAVCDSFRRELRALLRIRRAGR